MNQGEEREAEWRLSKLHHSLWQERASKYVYQEKLHQMRDTETQQITKK
jgi:hypothetical protein